MKYQLLAIATAAALGLSIEVRATPLSEIIGHKAMIQQALQEGIIDLSGFTDQQVYDMAKEQDAPSEALESYGKCRAWLQSKMPGHSPADTLKETKRLLDEAKLSFASLSEQGQRDCLVQIYLVLDQITDLKVKESLQTRIHQLGQSIKVIDVHWAMGGFNLVGMIKVSLKNVSKLPVGNIKYKTLYYSETGKVSESCGGAHELEKLVMPGQTRTFEINDGYIDREKAERMTFQVIGYDVLPDAQKAKK